jgi:transcriptional regulator with XRE-family HTH domain
MDLANRIKAIRGPLRQEDFANQLGVKKNTVGRWERGEQAPKMHDLHHILEVFPGINSTWLFTGEGLMYRNVQNYDLVDISKPIIDSSLGEDLIVNEENTYRIHKLIRERLGDRLLDLDPDKIILLTMILQRFYSQNFANSERFRRDTMRKNIEGMVKLAFDI